MLYLGATSTEASIMKSAGSGRVTYSGDCAAGSETVAPINARQSVGCESIPAPPQSDTLKKTTLSIDEAKLLTPSVNDVKEYLPGPPVQLESRSATSKNTEYWLVIELDIEIGTALVSSLSFRPPRRGGPTALRRRDDGNKDRVRFTVLSNTVRSPAANDGVGARRGDNVGLLLLERQSEALGVVDAVDDAVSSTGDGEASTSGEAVCTGGIVWEGDRDSAASEELAEEAAAADRDADSGTTGVADGV
jgi:hypothetical protein